ncbi:hypothetical protein V8G54_037183 [Vigna mungo]|uniref:Uncharacterized protein n=1 Tax=Vigna mungo TaxID=3915 RepID=A0AAQ3MIL4_VIGMU
MGRCDFMLPVCLAVIPNTKCGAAILQYLLSTFTYSVLDTEFLSHVILELCLDNRDTSTRIDFATMFGPSSYKMHCLRTKTAKRMLDGCSHNNMPNFCHLAVKGKLLHLLVLFEWWPDHSDGPQ